MDCVAIIPARYHSVRFPGKPLATLQGKALICHVVERCQQVAGVTRVIVATDDERIAAAVQSMGAEARMTPADLASGTDRVALVAESERAELILNVQGDEPLIGVEGLSRALRSFSESDAGIGTLRTALTNPADLWDGNVVKVVVSDDERALYFSRAPVPFPRASWLAAENERGAEVIRFAAAPELPGPYWVHVGVYMYRRQALARWARIPPSALERAEGLEQLRALQEGETIQTYLVDETMPGVDTPEDLERVRQHLGGKS